jgi:hypothetical protein
MERLEEFECSNVSFFLRDHRGVIRACVVLASLDERESPFLFRESFGYTDANTVL